MTRDDAWLRWNARVSERARGRQPAGWLLALLSTVMVCPDIAGDNDLQRSPATASASARNTSPANDRASGMLLLQVLLDRAGFSVGEIDGAAGAKTRKALSAFQQAERLPDSGGVLDAATLQALGGERSPTTTYVITAADMTGPFVETIPNDLMQQGELEALSYTSVGELLAERFHSSPRLLERLNPGVAWVEGASITVPDVEPATYPTVAERREATTLETAAQTGAVLVSKEHNDLIVESVVGDVLFYAPVSSGSEHDPLPLGEWKVLDVYLLPYFHYNPDLFWDANPSHAKTRIRPGPNNPVGAVWIDIDREHYGLHGTPHPSRVGVTESHGCVRLTNWDAMRLVVLVEPGTKVVFRP
jgi:lipoprotein-anchoring transpeptidase ErfK/SrfK